MSSSCGGGSCCRVCEIASGHVRPSGTGTPGGSGGNALLVVPVGAPYPLVGAVMFMCGGGGALPDPPS